MPRDSGCRYPMSTPIFFLTKFAVTCDRINVTLSTTNRAELRDHKISIRQYRIKLHSRYTLLLRPDLVVSIRVVCNNLIRITTRIFFFKQTLMSLLYSVSSLHKCSLIYYKVCIQ